MATERLYYHDAYLRAFTARVTQRADDGTRLYLDRTALYPTSGGQPHDLGTINGVAVTDVVDEGADVAHIIAAPVEAETVQGAVDWTRRLDFMQQHTGQHLLSAVFADVFGAATVSVHFGDVSSTLDLAVDALDAAQVLRAERLANDQIAGNHSVTISFEDAATAAGLRKASDREGTLRIVSIDGIDRSACGGTHVRSTAEIGMLLMRRQERVRSGTRIEFLCGLRAARRARTDYDVLASVAQTMSAAVDDVPALIATQQLQLKDAEHVRRRMDGELATYRAKDAYEATVPNPAGIRRHVSRHDTGALDDHRSFAIALSLLPGAVCVVGQRATRSVLLTASEDSGVDAGAAMKAAAKAFNGRGGGSARLAQGSFPDENAFMRALETLGA